MRRFRSTNGVIRFSLSVLLAGSVVTFPSRAGETGLDNRALDDEPHHVHADSALGKANWTTGDALNFALAGARRIGGRLAAWYRQTPPADRIVWGGLAACAGLGLGVLFERLAQLRKRKIVPPEFTARFLDRLHEGKLDCGQALDHCEINPSPAARVALAAVRRWGRPSADLERAVALAHRVESERLRRNVGTFRRIAILTPLLGLLGTLHGLGRALERVPAASALERSSATSTTALVHSTIPSTGWGPSLAAALTPLSVGIIIATLALVIYDGLLTRIEKLTGSLDHLGAETIDAIALAAPERTPTITLAHNPAHSVASNVDRDSGGPRPSASTPHVGAIRRDGRNDSTIRARHQETGF
jgi:biopolymer transport protein ExbB